MAVVIGSNFSYKGEYSNFERDSFKTLSEMKAFPDTSLDEGHISFCVETGKHYEFKKSNTVNNITGKWRLVVDTALDESSENPVQNKVLVNKFKSTESDISNKIKETVDQVNTEIKNLDNKINQGEQVSASALNELNEELNKGYKILSAAINDLRANLNSNTSININGHDFSDGEINLTKSDVGLGNVDNTSDVNKPVSTLQKGALDKKVDKIDKHSLISNTDLNKLKELPTNNDLNIALNELTDHTINTENPHNVTAIQVGLGDFMDLTPGTMPVSTLQQEAIDKKVSKTITINGHALNGNVEVTKTDLNLGWVDNTSDLDKPVSFLQQEALDKKSDSEIVAHSITDLADSIKNLQSTLSAAINDLNSNKVSNEDLNLKDDSTVFKKIYLNRHPERSRVNNIITQEDLSYPNTIYVVQYEFYLNQKTITMPENCILQFEGGSFNGPGTLNLSNTKLLPNGLTLEEIFTGGCATNNSFKTNQLILDQTNKLKCWNGTSWISPL